MQVCATAKIRTFKGVGIVPDKNLPHLLYNMLNENDFHLLLLLWRRSQNKTNIISVGLFYLTHLRLHNKQHRFKPKIFIN